MMPMFNVAGFSNKFNDVRAIDGVGFSIAGGVFFALLRPGASAKIVTPRAIGGIEAVESGLATCCGIAAADFHGIAVTG